MPSNFKVPRVRNRKWLDRVRDMRCVITGVTPCDPAHIRYGLSGGTGLKPPDDLVLPLSHNQHQIQHDIGELNFWRARITEDPHFMMECLKAYARQLYRENNP